MILQLLIELIKIMCQNYVDANLPILAQVLCLYK